MSNKKFFAFLTAAALLALAVFGGGCGGSSNSGKAVSASDIKGTVMGSLSAARLADCDIAPYIGQVMSVSSDNNLDISDLDDKRVLFIEDASELPSGTGSDTKGTYPELADVRAAYNDGLVIAAVYPDSEDVAVLCDALNLKDPPVLGGKEFYELFAVAWREVNGDYEPFTYTIFDLDNFTSEDVTDAPVIDSQDVTIRSEDIVATGSDDVIPAETTDAEFNKSRVKDFVDWVVTLDTDPESLRAVEGNTADTSEASDAPVSVAAGDKQLTELAKSEGPDTINADYRHQGVFPRIAGVMKSFPHWRDSEGKSKEHTVWQLDRRTRLKYDVYSIHSFDRNRDYFLIRARNSTNTQRQFGSVINEEAYSHLAGNNNARLMWGFTRCMMYNHFIEQDTGNGDVEIVASAPDSKADSQSKSTTMSYTFGSKVAVAANTKGEVTGTAEFNFSIGYSQTVSETATEYQITTKHNGDIKKRANASWEYVFSWPKEGQDIGDWNTRMPFCYRELVAWPSATAHTAHMEWIWAVTPAIWQKTEDNKLTVVAKVGWKDGLSQGRYARRFGTYWGNPVNVALNEVYVDRGFTLKRPPHLAVRPSSFSPTAGGKGFDKNAGNASFVLLSETGWTVKTDADWLTGFTPASGNATGSSEKMVTFSYTANDTGKPRTGTITVSNAEGDSFQIQVNQGGN